MSAPRNPPFRAEHLGSLLRPKKLLQARVAFLSQQASAADLLEVEDEVIAEIVKTQLDLGFRPISDGEYRFVQAKAYRKVRAD